MFYCNESDGAEALAQEVLAEEVRAHKVRAEKGPDNDSGPLKPYVYVENLPKNLPEDKKPSFLTTRSPGANKTIGIWHSVTVEVSGVHTLRMP